VGERDRKKESDRDRHTVRQKVNEWESEIERKRVIEINTQIDRK
jgi:hypothetical protein